MSSLEDFIFLTGMPFRWHAQHKISTDSSLLSNVNLLNLGHKHLKPPKTVLKPECVPSKTISLLKTIAAFLWSESIVFTNFYTNMDNINAKSISFCMTISIYKGQLIKVIGPQQNCWSCDHMINFQFMKKICLYCCLGQMILVGIESTIRISLLEALPGGAPMSPV